MARAIDWTALGEEAIARLRHYLTLDTTNPPGNETRATTWLAQVLGREGIASETAEAAPGRGNLVARVRGDGSLGGIVLHHHVDVVYADPRYWSVDPFAGAVREGFVYGRGALDMKATGILQLMALIAIARAGIRLKRDLILLATADEEAGSRFGAQFVVDQRPGWLAGAEYALSELGAIDAPAGYRAPLGHIVISEKTGLPLRLTARGAAGHGSMPWPDTAPHRLVRALGRLLAAERPPRVLPEVQQFFAALATVLPPADAVGLDRLEQALAEPVARRRILANRHWSAMLRATFAVTMLRGSEKLNVIPPEAVADIDCRMLPGDDAEEIAAWVRGVIADDQVQVDIMRPPKPPNLSPPDTELYKALADTLRRRRPGVVVAPEILVAFTDSWVFRRCGLLAYGWSPFVLDAEEWKGMHGNDERISLDNVRAGVRAYTEMLLAVAAA